MPVDLIEYRQIDAMSSPDAKRSHPVLVIGGTRGIGGGTRSVAAAFLNLFKGNTLRWRERAEGEIRSVGVDYSIIRCGVLVDAQAGSHVIKLSQTALPLSLRYRIARADVAEGFVAALNHPRASRATFEIVWGRRGRAEPWPQLLDRLQPDAARR